MGCIMDGKLSRLSLSFALSLGKIVEVEKEKVFTILKNYEIPKEKDILVKTSTGMSLILHKSLQPSQERLTRYQKLTSLCDLGSIFRAVIKSDVSCPTVIIITTRVWSHQMRTFAHYLHSPSKV